MQHAAPGLRSQVQAGTVAAIALGLALGVAQSAAAGDGALEINQSCVATGCFAGDAPGLPVTTQSGKKYVLTSDLAVATANQDGVSVASSATLDLNGFSIAGPITCTGVPPVCSGSGSGIGVLTAAGATVRNGAVRGMGSTGVQVSAAVLVEDLFIEQNAGEGIAGTADGSIVRGCRIYRNGVGGIGLAYGAGSPGSVITGNAVVENAGAGISVGGSLVTSNAVSKSGTVGLAGGAIASNTGFANNVFNANNGGNANNQTSGGKDLGQNVCGTRTTCP
jgi:hypothetical protein